MPDTQEATDRLLTAFDRGHARNPDREFRETWNVTREDISEGRVTADHMLGMLIIRSYQEYHQGEFSQIASAMHGGRMGVADGEVGPATELLFKTPRCGMPDFLIPDVPEKATLWNGPHQDNVLPESAIEAANWPGSCRNDLKFNMLFTSLPGLDDQETTTAFTVMCNIWTRCVDDLKIRIWREQQDAQKLDIYAEKMPLPGGTLAWSYLARNTCQVSLQQKYDTTVRWSLAQLVATATHEVGHALGMNHNRQSGSLLYPSITSALINRWGWPAAIDLTQMQRLGYQVSDTTPERPTPHSMYKGWWDGGTDPVDPTDPDPGTPRTKVGTLDIKGKKYGVYEDGGNGGIVNPF
jgi:hypothetical protein